MSPKIVKYFEAVQTTKTKAEAATIAGYSQPETSTSRIERSADFQALKRYYKDELLEQISMKDIAREHLKVLEQDNEMGPKLMAIKMAMEKIEPEAQVSDDDEKCLVIIK